MRWYAILDRVVGWEGGVVLHSVCYSRVGMAGAKLTAMVALGGDWL